MGIKKSEKAAINTVFGTAPVVETQKSKKAKKEDPQMPMSEDFENYVALILVEKALGGVKKQLDKQIKDQEAFSVFRDMIIESGKQPSPFQGVCGQAVAQFQFKKRQMGFDHDIAEMLDEQGVVYETVEKLPERFTINPEVLEDQAVLAKLAVAIKSMDVPYDIIQKQAPVYTYQFTDTTLDQISKLKDKEMRDELFRAISTLAVAQTKIDSGGTDELKAALEILQKKGILTLK